MDSEQNSQRTFMYTIVSGKSEEKRTLEEISAEQASEKELLGTAEGQDLGHCFYIGMRYCRTTRDFLRDVR